MAEPNNTDAYVGVLPCGCIAGFASPRLPARDLRRVVGDWLKLGANIVRWPVDRVRSGSDPLECPTHAVAVQSELLSPSLPEGEGR